MSGRTKPFSGFEFMIAWRYLRARRAEGGVSVMTWISFLGIALAVMALIATLAVRSGFRHEFVGTIVGANPHITVLGMERFDYTEEEQALIAANPAVADALAGRAATTRTLQNPAAIADAVRAVPGVVHAAAVIRVEVMASAGNENTLGQVIGIGAEDLATVPLVRDPEASFGSLERFDEGVAIGEGVARRLGLRVGDTIRLTSPSGAQTVGGRAARVGGYEVVYIFRVGRWDIDNVRIYMPFAEAQSFFDRDGVADSVDIAVDDPEHVEPLVGPVALAAGQGTYLRTWQDSSGAYLQALQMEDNIMFVILSILVLIATMNIVSGLIMLVKNKSHDIGILRTVGLSEGSILRVFFICGASVGLAGTVVGVGLGCAFAIWIDPIFSFVNWVAGGGVWDPSVRLLSQLPARLEWGDVVSAVSLSLGLSFVVTIFPARRAARMNPVEALRYE
ncbi:FtsX-like permease family protein [Rhodophyticola sp. CCM32]|uniref:ABC transporter permease n=1 Tax=Rhodophyticola sp. CCM32 TaxID=2916397 RepID=UPI00107F4832|nr:ABC transporter permease [Rhodophyticola sp. CCM32]QBY00197.1 FtsX-like permease family protein [Rhodophyticola sp. CCM32]